MNLNVIAPDKKLMAKARKENEKQNKIENARREARNKNASRKG